MPNRYFALYEEDSKPLNKVPADNVRKPASPQSEKSASPLGTESALHEVRKPANPQADKSTEDKRERYSTRLLPETIKAIRIYAIEHDMRDYEVVEQGFRLVTEQNKSAK